MREYMIIAQVDGIDYLTKIKADSESAAEHRILDMGVCALLLPDRAGSART